MKRQALIFAAPETVELREEEISEPGEGQALVRVSMSAISPGTEMLVYRGLVPQDMAVDASISALGSGGFQFPLKYGYACVGEVEALDPSVDPDWLGKQVFSFHPHESAFLASPGELLPIPEGVSPQDALFLPNMETALNFVMDGRPLAGEAVAVFGLGIVGLLTTALLSRFPLSSLVCFDRFKRRRKEAKSLGADAVLDPIEPGALDEARSVLQPGGQTQGADLCFEVSGSPAALNQAVALTGFSGRIVIGSWYGRKPVELDLGGSFHRSRIQLISSQVSTLDPHLSGRWTKARRLAFAWELLKQIQPARWITQRYPFSKAPEAYRLLAGHPEDAIQVIFEY